MDHAILGAGGVGGFIGAALAQAGEDVTLVVRPRTTSQYPRELSLDSTFGSFSAQVNVTESLNHPVDILWVTVKATQLEESLAEIPERTEVQGVVPLLNGIDHIAVLRARFGRERVIPATIAGEMERIAPGKTVHPSPFLRLNLASSGRALLDRSVEVFTRMGADCRFIDNESTLLWGKLVILAPFALSTTAAAAPIGEVLRDPRRRELMESCAREACEAALGDGAEVSPEAAIRTLNSSPAPMRSSMQKDVDARRTPELDAIAGPILRSAAARGNTAPATSDMVQQIQARIEAWRKHG